MTDPATTEQPMSNNQRRLLGAVSDLPAPWPSRERGIVDALARDLCALRSRLDWLVQVEEQFGEEQKAKSWNRAERNALIRVLQEHADDAQSAAASAARASNKYSIEYVKEVHERAAEAIEAGYTITGLHGPGILMNRDKSKPELRVPVAVWFYVRGYVRGLEDLG